MRYLLVYLVEHFAHQSLVKFNARDTLILAKEEVLAGLVELPCVIVQYAFLESIEVIDVLALVHLVD